ncbi:5'-3' exonuclease [Rhabdothermincola sediminis]|uniref:5'-3' exonuclease n=1 Tax=Rhabdothermincola sediminis TaxID=2751370 RepID=UPI001AA052D4|nr:5'-3' exonuclease H3TH domain-containing protein [Rhabdothermincola sediminis]
MRVHLVDGTYELFRYYFALPSHVTASAQEVAAVRGVVGSLLGLLEEGATHVGVATDHVIESYRNDLWPGYKSSAGVPADLLSQFPILEEALQAAGFVVWPMVELEADDALAAAAADLAADPRVEQVLICTPDKDLAQCVSGQRVVQLDRRRGIVLDEAAVVAKFGVPPASIPDYLALVGDSADGFPGLPGFGAKSAAALLARWGHLEAIPADGAAWDANVRGATKLAATLRERWADALLFRRIATLERDAITVDDVEALRWRGPRDEFASVARRIDAESLVARALRIAAARGG